MRLLRNFRAIALAILAVSGGAGGVARAESNDAAPAPQLKSAPAVVEFFISQACERCAPAAAYLVELAARPDVVALTWHVDYWNMMSNGQSGRWEDPFSDPAFTDRQRAYNRNIRNRDTVFTPQAIIGGDKTAIGSDRGAVETLIANAHPVEALDLQMRRDGDLISVDISSADDPCEAVLVTFRRAATTQISGGDNAGLTFSEANVVSAVRRLGALKSETAQFTAPAPGAGEGCALLIQEPHQGRIISAAYCPSEI